MPFLVVGIALCAAWNYLRNEAIAMDSAEHRDLRRAMRFMGGFFASERNRKSRWVFSLVLGIRFALRIIGCTRCSCQRSVEMESSVVRKALLNLGC